jgi:hypothetical protein
MTTEPGLEAVLTGGCACGRVRYRCRSAPFACSYCHCRDCRKVTGAPVTVFVGVAAADLEIDGAPVERAGTAWARRSFCPDCGTPIDYRDSRLPGERYLLAGTLDRPEAVRPTCHAFTDEAVAWLAIADDLPRYPRFSRSRGEGDPEA